MSLILASTSRYRKQLLERLGLPFRTVAPRFDEQVFHHDRSLGAAGMVRQLAIGKVNSVVAEFSLDTIVAADQVVELDGKILGKPKSIDRAINQLAELSGRSHRIYTAVAVWDESRLNTHVDITTMTMRTLDLATIQRYVMADAPIECAGAYKLESRGITLFERIEAADYTAIIGLPLLALTSMLRSIGYVIP